MKRLLLAVLLAACDTSSHVEPDTGPVSDAPSPDAAAADAGPTPDVPTDAGPVGNDATVGLDAPDDAPAASELYALVPEVYFAAIPNGSTAVASFAVGYLGVGTTGPIVEEILGPDAAAFSVTTACTPSPLDGTMNACMGEVTFAPTRVGTHTGTLRVSATPGGLLDIPIRAESTSVIGPRLEASPTLLAFPDTSVGATSAAMSATWTSTGDVPVTGLGFDVMDGLGGPVAFVATGTCATVTALAPGESCTASFVFEPHAAGAAEGFAMLRDGSFRTYAAVGLTGTGVAPAIGISRARAFASIATGATDTVTHTVTNTGSAPTGTLTTSVSGGAAFAITTDLCVGRSLAPAETCTLDVRFRPTTVGMHSATLTVGDGATTGTSSLRGTATPPSPLQISPATFDFGVWPTMGAPVGPGPQVFTVTNSGSTTGTLTVTAPADATFAITADTCAGTTLASGGTCRITVAFAPGTSAGVHTASLGVSASPGGTASASLRGVGGTANGLTLSPPGHNFGSVTGSESVTLTLTNGGSTARSTLMSSFAGRSPELSRTTTCGSTLAAGASCTIRVTYTAVGTTSADDVLLIRADGDTVLSAPISGFSF